MGFDRIGTLLGSTSGELVKAADAEVSELEDHVSADEQAFATLVRRRYDDARAPLNLSSLSSEVVREIPGAKSSDLFGNGTFRKALDQLTLLDVRFDQHHLWDERRHQPPGPTAVPETKTDAASI